MANTPEMFWARTAWCESGCREWLGPPTDQGYGQISFKAVTGHFRPVKVHRIAWALTYGTFPTELHHSCENRLCVNVEHLVEISHLSHSHLHNGYGCHFHGYQDWDSQGRCRICVRDAKRQRYVADPERFRAATRRWRVRHPSG